ncbi:hypothetical protein ABCS02_21410 [Microbacterium sp. X-17]|uniref:hypothetical protein n=1 Tax=Microbacterium sp. X-17 TaxID=3144404 RepID=UPI0031F5CA79
MPVDASTFLTMTGVVIALIVALGGLLAWSVRRLDSRFERVEMRVESGFARVDAELRDVRQDLGGVRKDVGDLAIAVARLEGPRPRLELR